MRRFRFIFLVVFVLSACGETRVAEVISVDPEGEIRLRHLSGAKGVPEILRFPVERPLAYRPGQSIRFSAKVYGEDGWLETSWPLQKAVAAQLADADWWRTQRRTVSAQGSPWGGRLGMDASRRWVDWREEAFAHGFVLVPFIPDMAADGALPVALAQAVRLNHHLALTEHRDLPWVFWSIKPDWDSVENCRRWESRLWGKAGSEVRWVSPCEEFVLGWRRWLGLPLYEVERQAPVRAPNVFVIDRNGAIAVRYEGWEWPLERLERTLNTALLKP